MKITKKQLKQIIKEELVLFETNGQEEVADDPPGEITKLSRSQARQAGIEQAKATGAAGITDDERAVIKNITAKLQAAAEAGNITVGTPLKMLQRLAAALEKL